MKARPILFSGPMVRALLAGSKTQTRRAVKLPTKTFSGGPIYERPDMGGWAATTHGGGGAFAVKDGQRVAAPEQAALWHQTTGMCVACPYGVPGDLLWVRESIHQPNAGGFIYRANRREQAKADGYDNIPEDESATRWTPSIHMPRWASRLTLEITDVRVERLQDISEADAFAEGASACANGCWFDASPQLAGSDAKGAYYCLWNSINGPDSWAANPWVWAVSFKVRKANVDTLASGRGRP